MSHVISDSLFEQSRAVIPGGVNSPVRAFASVGGHPPFIASASGSKLRDEDGNEYLDYVGSWGPMILGHARREVVQAVSRAAKHGMSFGAPTLCELTLARLIRDAFPSMGLLRLVNSGTEATMSAIRAARGFTGRSTIIKFEGCYHGHADCLLAKAGSGVATLGIPDSAGVPVGAAADTVCVPYNDISAVEQAAARFAGDLACIIVEPVAGNMGCVPPADGFLQGLRDICTRVGALLIFDEVMTGFRVARGGAQELLGVVPDLTTLGKIVGGGLPVGVYGGREDVMRKIAPDGPVYQAGTLSGNPIATAAGIAQLELLDSSVYSRLEQTSQALENGLADAISRAGTKACVQRVGSMLTLFFKESPVSNYDEACECDRQAFARFHRSMLEQGVYLPPSQFEAWFVSAAHTDDQIDQTIQSAIRSLTG